jgi:hypothetical protein
MFRTRLTDAAKESPNFAGHYRFTIWGCGSECISGAIIHLETGKVFSPPLANEKGSAMHFSVCQSRFPREQSAPAPAMRSELFRAPANQCSRCTLLRLGGRTV